MNAKILSLTFLALLTFGCGRSDDELRSLIRDELNRQTSRQFITEAETIGPYSPAVRIGGFLFVSGQIGLDPASQSLGNSLESQTRQAMENLKSVLQQAGYDSSDVVQCTVYLKNINDFHRMNLIYGGYFPEDRYPARVTVEVSNLPRNALIEIAAVAYKND